MRSVSCKLTFPDGASIVGRICARSPETEYPVRYAGAVDRLPRRYGEADAAFLKFHFRSLAKKHVSKIRITERGFFDTHCL
jgi:hypothetical protein